MQMIFELLSRALGIYSLLIMARIILTWFGGAQFGRPLQLLSSITDPYLDWWRQKLNLRVGFLDLSPIAGIMALNIVQTICSAIARQGTISIGVILAVCLQGIWSAVSFLLGFCIIVLILRLIGYFINANLFSPFWRIVDSISRPMLYRINRMIFGKRLVHFLTGIIVSIVLLVVIWYVGRYAAVFLVGFLLRL